VRLEPLGREHADELWRAAQGADASFVWLRYGPFASQGELRALMMELAGRADQPFWAVRRRSCAVSNHGDGTRHHVRACCPPNGFHRLECN